ncbi:autophagy-related protein 22-like protein [Diaporthe sp. PMI_573]|nr:autophagy-related protein 22-like protein [Diaporthaceae sp. PMI_573]
MDQQTGHDKNPGTLQEEIAQDTSEQANVDEKGVKAEKYAYYSLFAANNGIGPYQYAYSLFQTLIYQAAFNPNILPWGSASCDEDPDAPCHVRWAGGSKSYESVALIASALVFVGQSILFIFIGSTADYGSWAPWILRISVLIYGGLSLGFFGLQTPGAWPAAMALYVLTNIGFYVVFTFGYALFPRIADDQPEARKARLALQNQDIKESKYETTIEHIRSTIANHAWAANNVGFAVSACLCLAILKGIDADSSATKNNLGYALSTGVVGIIVLVFSVPWVFFEKRRSRLPVPEGRNIVSYGLQQTWHSFKYCRRISQTFLYLFVYFWLNDGVSTLFTMLIISQTAVAQFSATQNSYFLIVQGVSVFFFTVFAVWAQKKWSLRTKTILHITNWSCFFLAVWGMVGLWTKKIGYHNLWEFWAVSVFYGPSVGLQMSYSQVFLGQVIPRGEENRYFALLGFIGRVGSWIGPLICSAIVDRTGSQNASYGFLAALIGASSLGLIFVDEQKSKRECAEYSATEHPVETQRESPAQGREDNWETKS